MLFVPYLNKELTQILVRVEQIKYIRFVSFLFTWSLFHIRCNLDSPISIFIPNVHVLLLLFIMIFICHTCFSTLLAQAPVVTPAAREMKKEEEPKPKRIELAEPKERERERVVVGAGGIYFL